MTFIDIAVVFLMFLITAWSALSLKLGYKVIDGYHNIKQLRLAYYMIWNNDTDRFLQFHLSVVCNRWTKQFQVRDKNLKKINIKDTW